MVLLKGILLVSSLAVVTSYHSQGVSCGNEFIASWSGGVFNSMKDRVYQFSCTSMSLVQENCTYFASVNAYSADFDFACTDGGIVAISSYFSDADTDRVFSFNCCYPSGYGLGLCSTSDYINDWLETYNYTIPEGTVIKRQALED